MKKLFALILGFITTTAFAQTVPNGGITPGLVWTVPQWNAAWQAKVDITARTAAEIAAAVTPTNTGYLPGNVLRYGADPTGASDSTTAIINAHKLGIVVTYPQGTYTISNNIPIPCGGIIGAGPQQTIITSTSTASTSLFIFTCPNAGIFKDFTVNAASMTGGYVLTVTASSGENKYTKVENLYINGAWSGLSFIAASHWIVSQTNFNNITGDGITVNNTNVADSGDSSVTNCNFNNVSQSLTANGVRQIASGGLKIIGNKFNGPNIGYNLDLGTGSTGVLLIDGNSFENLNTEPILIQRASGSAVFQNINIVGNEFLLTSGLGIVSNPASSIVTNLNITGNTFFTSPASANSAIFLGFINGLSIVGNTFNSVASSSGNAVNLQPGNTGVILASNSVTNYTTPYNATASAAATIFNGFTVNAVLSGTTSAISAALTIGTCTSGTVAVTNSTTAMSVVATPVTYPGDGFWWEGYVSSAGTVTVKVCSTITGTPTSTNYNVRVVQ